MGRQMDKAGLWTMIREQHPELARALKDSNTSGDEYVAIEGYSGRTNRWLMAALDRENPALASLLRERVLPDKDVFGRFGKPVASVAIVDLIAALLAFQGRQEAA